MMQQPNILFIFSDDHALNAISAYGGPLARLAPTPHIDRLAREGAIFPNSFCANSICGPSRACILTGKHSHINGFVDNDNSQFDGTQWTFPKAFQKAGYQTAIIGKWHLVTDPTGFDYWEIVPGQGNYYNPDFLQQGGGRKRYPGHVTERTTKLALDWLDKNRDKSKPFVLMCQHKAPHRNWMIAPEHFHVFKDTVFPEPKSLFDSYENRATTLKTQKMQINADMTWTSDLKVLPNPLGQENDKVGELNRMTPDQAAAWKAAYAAENKALLEKFPTMSERDKLRWKYQRYLKDYLRCVRGVDESVGELLDYLDKSGLAKNTVVIYASDQGFYLGEHGWFDKRWMFEESVKMPFLIRWPGVIKPGSKPEALIQNIDYAATFLELAGIPAPTDLQGQSIVPILKTGKTPKNFRKAIYYRYSGEKTHNVAPHDGVRTDRHKLMYFPSTKEWNLFDLKRDPSEMRSVHSDPGYAKTLAEMKALYMQLRAEYKAPEW
ncbi:sulfatase [Armatimonas sp.]|uniref:sulfatase family protein n=1 Tax=Armatimonas sp. TaxID=1872638 RepID=UPI0037529400